MDAPPDLADDAEDDQLSFAAEGRRAWRLPEHALHTPISVPADRDGLMEELARMLEDRLRDPRVRAFFDEEAARRLEQTIAYVKRLHAL